MAIITPTTEVLVECSRCGTRYQAGSPDYVKFHAMLTVGEQGGLIGPQPTVWCRFGSCGEALLAYLERYIGLTAER